MLGADRQRSIGKFACSLYQYFAELYGRPIETLQRTRSGLRELPLPAAYMPSRSAHTGEDPIPGAIVTSDAGKQP
jgi:hypothetical protein